MPNPPTAESIEQQGFSLRSVCWGYREIFANAIQDLFDAGVLGGNRRAVTEQFYRVLRDADQCCYDHVLKEFLAALHPTNRWLMDLPGIFTDLTDLGKRFAEDKIYHGSTFFRVMAEGGLGSTPAEARFLVSMCHRLFEIDADVAAAFVQGYARMLGRLQFDEIEQFVVMGRRILTRNRDAGLAFFACTSKAAENTMSMLTHECRLQDVRDPLQALLRALTGRDVEMADLGGLDADELIEHGSSFVCMYLWCYVPARVRIFNDAVSNRDWYRLLGVVAAGMLAEGSLPAIQGQPGCRHIDDLVPGDPTKQTLVVILEYVRVLQTIRARWPGVARLIDFGIRVETPRQPESGPEQLLLTLLRQPDSDADLQQVAETSANIFDTINLVTPELVQEYANQAHRPLRAWAFLPDFYYPAEVSTAAGSQLLTDLKSAADDAQKQRTDGDEDEDAEGALAPADSDADDDAPDEEQQEADGIEAAFVYDEWCQAENDYLENYCKLQEVIPDAGPEQPIPQEILNAAQRVRRVFENLKPEVARKEKYLDEGDEINTDLLHEYIIDRHREPAPKIRFYEKPLIKRRDLAVSILLDTSGSTGEQHGERKVLEIEKQAAMILAEGLSRLGDRFEIGGFNSNGREFCQYLVFKAIDEEWSADAIRRLQAARPANSTRMGVALRHAGWRLSKVEARQRLIIVVTDGKPMDSDYSPESRYAQYDVRMACEENERQQIATFAISTEENTIADMEIMFPQQRFAILDDLQRLPAVLPRLYIRLTV